jgi:hypothetical protein
MTNKFEDLLTFCWEIYSCLDHLIDNPDANYVKVIAGVGELHERVYRALMEIERNERESQNRST